MPANRLKRGHSVIKYGGIKNGQTEKLLQLLGLIVILISVLIYYGYNHMNKKSDNTTDNNVSVTETVVPTATNIAEEDSNGNKTIR